MPRLRALSCIVPEHQVSDAELSALLLQHSRDGVRSRLGSALEASASPWRHTVLPLAQLARLAGIGERSVLYRRHATDLALRAVSRLVDRGQLDTRAVSKIVFVSGSGHATPSIDADIVRRFGLRPSCRRVTLSQLGCAGGAAALATAADLVREPGDAVLVVSAEVPSLQLPLAEPSLGELVAAAQFGDGAAAAVIASDGDGPEIVDTMSELLPEIDEGGSVLVHESGLRLRASGDLAGLIRRRIASLLRALLQRHGLDPSGLAFVAGHPRSAQVLEAIGDGLALDPAQLAGSRAIWQRCGNMISASIFAALAESVRCAATRTSAGVAATVAFGAGTSCEMALLRWQQATDLEQIGEAWG